MLSATMLALSLLGSVSTPAVARLHPSHEPVCVSVERTGTFRITTTLDGSSDVGLGLVILENVNGCLEATFVTDAAAPAAIDHLSLRDDTLTGSLKITAGDARLSLHFVGAAVDGSIVQGRNAWAVAGRKTS